MTAVCPYLSGVCTLCANEIKATVRQKDNQCDASCPRLTGLASDANEKARAVADLFCKTHTAHTKALGRGDVPRITYQKRLRAVKAPWCACVRAKIAIPKNTTADVLKRCMGCWTPPKIGVDDKMIGSRPSDRFVHLTSAGKTGLLTPAASQEQQGDVRMGDDPKETIDMDTKDNNTALLRHAYVESDKAPASRAQVRTRQFSISGGIISIESIRRTIEKSNGLSRQTLAARAEYLRSHGDEGARTKDNAVTGEKHRLIEPEPREKMPEHPMKKPRSVTPKPDTSGPKVTDKGSESPERNLPSGSKSSSSDEDEDDNVTHISETTLSLSSTETDDEEGEETAVDHREPSLELDQMIFTSSFSFVPDSEEGSSEIGVGTDDNELLPDDEDIESLGEYEVQNLVLDLPYDFFESMEVPPLTQETDEGDVHAEPHEEFDAVHPLDGLDDFIDVSLNLSIDMPEELEASLVGNDDDDDDDDHGDDGDHDEDENTQAPAPADEATLDHGPDDNALADNGPANETRVLTTIEAAEAAADAHLAHVEAVINAGDLVFEHRVKQDQVDFLGEKIRAWETGIEEMPFVEQFKEGVLEKIICTLKQRLSPKPEHDSDIAFGQRERIDTACEGDVDSCENDFEDTPVPVANMLTLPTGTRSFADSVGSAPTISVVPPTPTATATAPASKPTAPVIRSTTPKPGEVIEILSSNSSALSTDTEDDESLEAGGDSDSKSQNGVANEGVDDANEKDEVEGESEAVEETEFEGFANDFIVVSEDKSVAEDVDEPEFEGFPDVEDSV